MMKSKLLFLALIMITLGSCTSSNTSTNRSSIQLQGTWQLLSATTVTKGESTHTDYTKDQRMIKIINDSHFAFLKHDLKLNKEGKNNFDAGGGRYTLNGDQYVEFLDYYNDKNWEGKKFTFQLSMLNDTLIQTGIEKVSGTKIDRTITEKYLRIN